MAYSNLEKRREYERRFRAENGDHVREGERESYARNRKCGQARSRRSYIRNKDRAKAYRREYYVKNKERAKRYNTAYRKRWNRMNRKLVVDAYGGKCTCCGETEQVFLCIDHVFNDGKEHRKEIGEGSIYKWLIKNSYPKDRFQLLCHNCNFAKNLGVCPHVACEEVPF